MQSRRECGRQRELVHHQHVARLKLGAVGLRAAGRLAENLRASGLPSARSRGCVYVLTNPARPGHVSIDCAGRTLPDCAESKRCS